MLRGPEEAIVKNKTEGGPGTRSVGCYALLKLENMTEQ